MGELKRLQEGKKKVDPLSIDINNFESASIRVKRKANDTVESFYTATPEDQAETSLNLTVLSDTEAEEQEMTTTRINKLPKSKYELQIF